MATNAANCGRCGNRCPAGQACRGGDCATAGGSAGAPVRYAYALQRGNRGAAAGQFAFTWAVAHDAAGDVYVADFGNHRVQKFAPDGAFVAAWGGSGRGDGQFFFPYGIAAMGGVLYVTDGGNGRVQKFDADGRFLGQWASNRLAGAAGLAAVGGAVYVAGGVGPHVQVFDPDGALLAEFGGLGSGEGQFDYPQGVAVDAAGRVYAADTFNQRIQRFDPVF